MTVTLQHTMPRKGKKNSGDLEVMAGENRPLEPVFVPPSSPTGMSDFCDVPSLPVTAQQLDNDGTLQFFYKPHTLFFLGAMSIIIGYYGVMESDIKGMEVTVKHGIYAAVLVFLVIAMTQFRDGPFTRPHAAFWRIVQGISILYLIFFVFLLFQSAETARKLLSYYDPSLNLPLPEQSYAEDCRIFTPENPESYFYNIKTAVFDEFMIAHFLGWFGKTIVFKDVYLALFSGVLFELLEYSLEHILPNFKECWWDHLLLDLLGANALGIFLGWRFIQFFQLKTYDWIGWHRIPTWSARFRRALLQITPRAWTAYTWDYFKDFRRFMFFLFMLFMVVVNELNAFFLKTVLWIPSSHRLNVYRLIIWFFFACVAFREVFQYVVDSKCKKLGTQAWLCCAINLVEMMVWIKFSKEMPMWGVPTPPIVKYGWIIGFSVLALWSVWYFPRKERRRNMLAQMKEK